MAVHVGRMQKCPVPPATRGDVRGFSRASRGRLLKTLAKVNRQEASRALFVTLTYPLSESVTYSLSKVHLDSFVKRLQRKFVRCAVIWRLELQKNNQIHFHLIVLNQRFIPHEWVNQAWKGVVYGNNGSDRYIRTETRRVTSFKEAFSYAAKYAAKVPDDESADTEGRVWGIYGRRYLPVHLIQWELEPRGEARLTRAICNVVRGRSRGARASPYDPRWLVMDGQQALRMIAWAAELEIG